MKFLLGVILLFTAAAVTVAGTLTQAGGSQGFLFGVDVGVVGMIGLGFVRGDVGRRTASRRLRQVSDPYRSETSNALPDRDRLLRELHEKRAHDPTPSGAASAPHRPLRTVDPVRLPPQPASADQGSAP
jgi:hypothetical protein